MTSWSTLIVAGRIDASLTKEKLPSLISNCLITCYGTEASLVDADYAQFAAAFTKPTLSNEFGLTNAHSGTSGSHLVRVQWNPTSEQFRSALREALRHALSGARPTDSVAASTGGRVSVVYVGQVLGLSGEWLLADSSLSGQVLTSWLDSDAARSWWPQLDKLPNLGDRLHLQLFTPLAGTGTSWSPTKPGHPNRLITHVDAYLVQLDLAVEASWRSNGRPVVMDTLGSAYDGIRTFAQLAVEHHTLSQFELTTNGPPLGCALAAERPTLYVFPGGGVASLASGLFSLQGFTMLINGSFTSNGAPGWWSMVRNLPKLDTIVLPDWSAASVLTHQFVSESRRFDSAESHVLGDLLAPPPCALAPGEVTGGLVIHAPSTADQPRCFHWASNTADASPPAITLYFKIGWGELKLQPLAQRSGLLLIWTSALPASRIPSSLRILYPATLSSGTTTPAQTLARLIKALGSVEPPCTNGGVESQKATTTTAHGKSIATKHAASVHAKPTSDSSSRSLTQPARSTITAAAASNHAPTKPTVESQPLKKPSVPKRPATATARPTTATTVTTKPQLTHETKPQSAKPQPASRPLPSRPATAPKAGTTRPATATTKSSQPTRSETAAAAAAATTTANRLAAHANLVASKQPGSKPKAPPTSTAAHSASKPVAKPTGPIRTANDKVSKTSDAAPPIPPTLVQPEPTKALNESLELAPMDPLITGWLPTEQQSPVGGELTSPQTTVAPAIAADEHQEPDFSELYRVHKYEHLNEADEMALDDDRNSLADTHVDTPPTTDEPKSSTLTETKPMDYHAGDHLTEITTETPQSPSEPENLPNQMTNSTVSDVLKLIDPSHDQTDFAHELQAASLVSTDLEAVSNSSDLMSRPPPFLEANLDHQEPAGETEELLSSHVADLMEGPPSFTGVHDPGSEAAFAAAAAAAAATEPIDMTHSKEPLVYAGLELHDQDTGDHHVCPDESRPSHELPDEFQSANFTSDPVTEFADSMANRPAEVVPDEVGTVPIESETHKEEPVEEPVAEPLHSTELRSRPPLDIGLEDDSLPDVISQISMPGEQAHCPKFTPSLIDHETLQEQVIPPSSVWDRMEEPEEPVVSAPVGSPPVDTNPSDEHDMNLQDVVPAVVSDSHDQGLHVEVEADQQRSLELHDTSKPVHLPIPYDSRVQLGSPSSDTSELEVNDREFWVSTNRAPQSMTQPMEPDLSSPDLPSDVVVESHDLIASHAHQDWSAPDVVMPAKEEKPSEVDHPVHPDFDGSAVQPTDVVRLSADSLEATQEEEADQRIKSLDAPAPDVMDFGPVDADPHSLLAADSTTNVGQDMLSHARPVGFVACVPDEYTTDPTNLGSPLSEASVDSVVHTAGPAGFISASNPMESNLNEAIDGRAWPIGFKHPDSEASVRTNGQNGLRSDDVAPTNGVHTENGNHVGECAPDYMKKAMSFMPSEIDFASEVHSAGDCPMYPPLSHENEAELPPIATCPIVPPAPGDSKLNEAVFDPLSAWGQPQGMPAPAPPQAKPDAKHKASASSSNNRPGGSTQRPSSALKPTTATKPAATGSASPTVLPPGPPIYLDLIWVPSYLAYVPQSLAVEFFARVRARVYVISGEALHPTVGEALLAGKAKWNPGDVDLLCRSASDAHLSILPTDEPYEWACWLRTPAGREDRETGETRLQASGFRVMPTASLCDIEYSANNVAFRCEGVRVDF